MKLTILALGSIKENWMKNGVGEYIKRLMPFAKVQVIERNESKMPGVPSQADKQRILEEEGEKILKYVGEKDCVVLLDLKGEKMSSEDLAQWLENKMVAGNSSFCFMIGGPYGNGENLRKRANLKLSLSDMTFTHQMSRLILVEQLYRSMKIIHHEPYHL